MFTIINSNNSNSMKKCIILTMLMALFMSAASFAQGIKGTVIDENGDPVIGATVTDKSNNQNATITDLDGNFAINVKAGGIVVVSYIGYETQELAAKNGMTVKLQPDNKVLDEVVVVGYGVQKKSSVTGAISQVKPEDMENRTISNAQQALQGKTSGTQRTILSMHSPAKTRGSLPGHHRQSFLR